MQRPTPASRSIPREDEAADDDGVTLAWWRPGTPSMGCLAAVLAVQVISAVGMMLPALAAVNGPSMSLGPRRARSAGLPVQRSASANVRSWLHR